MFKNILDLGKRRRRRKNNNIRRFRDHIPKEPVIVNDYSPPVTPIPDYKIIIIGTVLGINKQGEEVMYMSNDTYQKYFERLGQVHLVSCYSPVVHDCDLLVLPGGADINPLRYGQKPSYDVGAPNLAYEWFDKYMLPQYIANGTPIAGICRGFQDVAVEFGCELIQHKEMLPRSVKVGNYKQQHKIVGNRSKVVENLEFTERFAERFQSFSTGINSLHHQIVAPELSDDILPVAYSREYGNLELLTVRGRNIAAFAYHPEELVDKRLADYVINSLIKQEVAGW